MSIPSVQAVLVGTLSRNMRRSAAVVAACAAISACTLIGHTPDQPTSFADGVAGLPEWQPVEYETRRPSGLAAATPEAKPEEAGPPQPPLDYLVGTAPSNVLAALGTPNSSEQTRTAQRWRYAGPDCEIDLLFFFDVAGDRYRLAMISRDGQTIDAGSAASCLAGPSIAMKPS